MDLGECLWYNNMSETQENIKQSVTLRSQFTVKLTSNVSTFLNI